MDFIETKNYRILNSVTDSLKESLKRSQVIVCQLSEKQDRIQSFGSGTLARIGQKYFIVTAGHVIKDLLNAYGLSTIIPTFNPPLPVQDEKSWIKCVNYNKNYHFDNIDVGLIELEDFVGKELKENFIPLDRFRKKNEVYSSDIWFFFNFPTAALRITDSNDKLNINMKPYCLTVDEHSINSSLVSEDFVYLNYIEGDTGKTTKGKEIQLLDPHGISGTSFWSIGIKNKPQGELWFPDNALFSAIDCTWDSKRGFVKGVKVHHWFKLLVKHSPELFEVAKEYI